MDIFLTVQTNRVVERLSLGVFGYFLTVRFRADLSGSLVIKEHACLPPPVFKGTHDATWAHYWGCYDGQLVKVGSAWSTLFPV